MKHVTTNDIDCLSTFNLQAEFPGTEQQGCFFHLTQCIMRKIQALGFKARYKQDAEFALNLRLLAAIAFVPVDLVEMAFEVVVQSCRIPDVCSDITAYFEDMWIGSHPRNAKIRS
jgi:hypothetical protein